jgi:hypothetical protein
LTDRAADDANKDDAGGAGGVEHFLGTRQTGQESMF